MSEFINTIDVLGDDNVFGSIIDKTITEFKDNRVNYMRNKSFYGCTLLETVDIPNVGAIEGDSFYNCSVLKTVVLRKNNKIVRLGNSEVFKNTPIESGDGYIYVPKIMTDGSSGVESYRAATNWSTYATQIRAIEDYPKITGG